MKESNWRSSGKKQEKPKQSHARRRQKKKQLKNMANKLKGVPEMEPFLFLFIAIPGTYYFYFK